MNAFVTAATLETRVNEPGQTSSAARPLAVAVHATPSRSWLRCGVVERAAVGVGAATGLWLMVAWALSVPGVA